MQFLFSFMYEDEDGIWAGSFKWHDSNGIKDTIDILLMENSMNGSLISKKLWRYLDLLFLVRHFAILIKTTVDCVTRMD